MDGIPVLRPLLPAVDSLLPYLRRIDEARYYTNNGPLWQELKERFAAWLALRAGVEQVFVVPTSSGTTAIELSLRARAMPGYSLCLMPAYTFIASAHAVANVGLEPYLLDCDETTLMLTPEIAASALASLTTKPAAVLVVSAFGAPLDVGGWIEFERIYGVPVVFDAAAAVTSLTGIGAQPMAVSLHATKVFGIGEGGAIVTTDRALADRLVAMTSFGFQKAERISTLKGGNYRISEYTAAMGLVVLDQIEASIERNLSLGQSYRDALDGKRCRLQRGAGTSWATMTFNVIIPKELVEECVECLDHDEIQWRRWWGFGIHKHPAFSDLRHRPLNKTDEIAPCVIGVPFFDGLSRSQIDRVVAALR